MKREVQIILTADDGKYLTDGNEYLNQIRLPEGADETVWNEITKEEYQEIVASNNEESIE